MNPKDQSTQAERKPWMKPAVIANKAAHAEGSIPRPANHDGVLSCSS